MSTPDRSPPTRGKSKANLADITVNEAHRSEEKQSKKIVREAKQVLQYHDSTFSDQLNALRVLIFVTLEHPRSSKMAWYISIALFLCILLNSVSFIASTVPSTWIRPDNCARPVCVPGTPGAVCTKIVCRPEENATLAQIELWTIVVFTIDYLLRLVSVPAVPVDLVFPRSLEYTMDGRLKDRSRYYQMSPWRKTTKYMFSGLNIIDLVSIIPYYLSMIFDDRFQILRMLRFLRFLLIFKLGRRFRESGAIIYRTLRASLPALLIFIFLTTMMAITFGSLMYVFEGGMFAVSEAFPAGGFLRPNARNTAMEESPFVSIFTGIYWYIVNTTTLGNSGLFPTTTGGRIASCFIAYCGLFTLALPITIIGQNFSAQYNLCYRDHDMNPHILYPGTPRTPRRPGTPRKRGMNSGPGTPSRSFREKSTIVGGEKQDLNYSSPDQEIEALRAELQQQIDALRLMHMQGAAAGAGVGGEGGVAANAAAQQEIEQLRAFVQKEINGLKAHLAAGAGVTPPLSEDDDTEGGQRGQAQEERDDPIQRALREAEINNFRTQIREGIRRFTPQEELETFRGGLY